MTGQRAGLVIRSKTTLEQTMFCYYVRLYIVADPENGSAFRAAWQDRGTCRELCRTLQPNLVAVDLLRSLNSDSMWLSIEFWLNEEAHLHARNLPTRITLNEKLHAMCDSIIDIGAFTFPTRVESVEQIRVAEARAAQE
jgi:hypothetical protein